MSSLFEKLANPILNWLNRESPPRDIPLSNFERIRYELKPCDVILVEGRSRVAEVIKLITQSPWSHAALYLGRLHDIENPETREKVACSYPGDPTDQLLIESELGVGTIIRPLTFYEKDHLRICRPTGLAYGDCQKIIEFTVMHLGISYDIRHVIDLARFLLPWEILPRRWRSTLFNRKHDKTTETICSKMIAEAFASIQFPILPLVKKEGDALQIFRQNPRLCTPSHFDYSPYFEIIKYPFIDHNNHTGYRLMPWHGSARLKGEEAELYLNPLDDGASELQAAPRDDEIAENPDAHQSGGVSENPGNTGSEGASKKLGI